MNHLFRVFLSLLALVILLGFTMGCGKPAEGKLTNPILIKDGNGKVRNFNLYLPKGGGEGRPLLVYFHGVRSEKFKTMPVLKGYTGSPVDETGLIPFCNTRGIVLLEMLPSYSYRNLNVEAHGWSPFEKETGGIETCIDSVIKEYEIDVDQIYLAGISAGAVMCNHLANRRPEIYRGIISHSQAHISERDDVLDPVKTDRPFRVVICYTKGDYQNLKDICEKSYVKYRDHGYSVTLIRDLPPKSHKWSNSSNGRLWRLLTRPGTD